MQVRSLGVHFGLHDLLRIVPRATGVGHENGLVKTDDGQRNQVTDEEEGFDEGAGQGAEKHRHEDVEHAFLRVDGADLDDLLAVLLRRLDHLIEPDVRADELDRTVGTGRHGLCAGAREPEDGCPAGDQAEQERRMQQRQLVQVFRQSGSEQHDNGKNHGRRADHCGADQHGLGRCLEGVAGAVVLFEQELGGTKVEIETEVPLHFRLDPGHLFDHRQFVNRLRVVGDRPVAVYRNRHRSHPQEAEGDQPEREDRGHHRRLGVVGIDHRRQVELRHDVGAGHQADDDDADPERGEVAGDDAGQDVEAGAAGLRRRDHFAYVPRVGRREHLDDLGNDRAGERAERDDQRKLPPEVAVWLPVEGEASHQQIRDDEGDDHGNHRRDPHQRGQRRFEIEAMLVAVPAPRNHLIAEIRDARGDDHHHPHDKQPDQQLHLDGGFGYREHDEADQRHAGDTVGLEAVSRRAHRVAGVVAGTVGDHPGVARIVLLDAEFDLHQIGTDVGDLREDAAGDAQCRGAQRLADGKADEALAGQGRRDEQHDAEHDQQFGRDQQHADRDSRLDRYGVDRIGLGSQRRECRAAVGQGVDAYAEPGHSERAGDADQGEGQDHRHVGDGKLLDDIEVADHDHRGEGFQDQQELALREHVGLAGFVDQFADFGHRAMYRQALDLTVDDGAEDQAAEGNQQPPGQ